MEQFPSIDVEKLMVESPSGSGKGYASSDGKDSEEGGDLSSLP